MLTRKIVEKIQEEFISNIDGFLCFGSDTFESFWGINYERDAIRNMAQKLINQGLLKDAEISGNSIVLFKVKLENNYNRNIRLLFLEELLKSDLI